jgi:hypothetical protein
MQYNVFAHTWHNTLRNIAELVVSSRLLRYASPAYLVLMTVVWSSLLAGWLTASRGYSQQPPVYGTDFLAFYTSGRIADQHPRTCLYDLTCQQAIQQSIVAEFEGVSAYLNPPHYALIFVPLSRLPYSMAFAIWTCLVTAAFVAGTVWLRSFLSVLREQHTMRVLLLALMFTPVYFAISAGQNTGLSLLLHTAIAVALLQRRDMIAGSLIALGLFKPQLFISLLPLLLLDRRWRVLPGFAAGAIAIVLLNVWVFGLETLSTWIALLRSPVYHAEVLRQSAKMFSWQSLWAQMFGASAAAQIGGWFCAGLTFGCLCLLWRRTCTDVLLRYAITVCGLVLIGPHLFVYDLGLLVLPGLVFADRALYAPIQCSLWLRFWLIICYVTLLFAADASLHAAYVIVPLLCITAWQAARLPIINYKLDRIG